MPGTFENKSPNREVSLGDAVMVTKPLREGEAARNIDIPAIVVFIDYRGETIGVVYEDKSREAFPWSSNQWRKV